MKPGKYLRRIGWRLFVPGLAFMSRLNYRKKSLLMGLIITIPMVVSMGLSFSFIEDEVIQRQRNLLFLQLASEINQLFMEIQQHRGMSNALVMGGFKFGEPLRALGDKIEAHMDRISAEMRKHGFVYEHQWSYITSQWRASRNINLSGAVANWQSLTSLIEEITRMIRRIGSNLFLNPRTNPRAFNLVEAAMDDLPVVMETIGRARGRGAGLLASGGSSVQDRIMLENMSARIHSQLEKLQDHVDGIAQSTEAHYQLQKAIGVFKKNTQRFETRIRQALQGGESISPEQFFSLGTSTLKTGARIQAVIFSKLDDILHQQINRFLLWKHILVFSFFSALGLILYFALAYYQCITRAIKVLDETATRIRQGRKWRPLHLEFKDELGQIVHSFNKVARKLTHVSNHIEAIVELAVDGIIAIDRHGTILEFNPAAERIFGYDMNEVIGKNITILMPEQYRSRHESALEQYVKEGIIRILDQQVEVEGLRKDGTVFPMELTVSEIQTEQRIFSGFIRDISGRKRMEAERIRLATAVEQATEAIIITDPEGVIQYVNPAFEELTGYSRAEAVGQTPKVLKSGKQPEEFYVRLWECITSGQAWRAEVINKRKDGSLYHAEHIINPIFDSHGEIVNFVGFQRDITESRHMQAKLEHVQRLESLGVLAGGIAHDFNNFLTTILGNTVLATGKCISKECGVHRHLEKIRQTTSHAADLCRQMLDYAGKGKQEAVFVDLSSLVSELAELLKVSIHKKVDMAFCLADGLPAVKVDEAQIRQVVMNLVINASDAIGDKGGRVSLFTGTMDVDGEYLADAYADPDLPTGRYVYLRVSDTGCGIDEQTRKKLFDPFFSTKQNGRGLGLSTVLGIVRSHRGIIKLDSRQGKGTTFTILFPTTGQESAVVLSGNQDGERDWKGHGTLMVVEDEESIREVTVEVLEEMGFKVLACADGLSGVETYREHHREIVAVLLDLSMPKLDGRSTFKELKRINPDVQVIITSGYGDEEVINSLKNVGLAGFIPKPYSPELLRSALNGILKMSESL